MHLRGKILEELDVVVLVFHVSNLRGKIRSYRDQ